MPEYNAMIRRAEDGPDPLVPEPVSTERAKGGKPKAAKRAGKSAKAVKKGKK